MQPVRRACRTSATRRGLEGLLGVLTAMLVLLTGWPALPAFAEEPPPTEPAVVTVSGVVTDAATTLPLAGVTVEDLVDEEVAGTTVTAVDGTYSLTVSPGDHRVRASLLGYADSYYRTVDDGGEPTDLLTVTDSDRPGINISLDQYGSIAGRATAATGGAGVGGVRVRFFDAASSDPNPVDTVTTTADGNYVLETLPSGRYLLQFDAAETDYRSLWWDGAATRDEADVVVVAAGAHLVGRDVSLVEGSRISGTVTDPAGTAVAGATVCPVGTFAGTPSCTATDAQGRYTLRGLYPGQYSLSASASGFLSTYYGGTTVSSDADRFSVPESASVTGKDVQLKAGAHVSGTVRDDAGDPVAGAQVCVGGYCVSTRSDGTYLTPALPAGSYSPYAYLNWADRVWADPIVLAEGEHLLGVDFTLDPTDVSDTGISGWVTLADGAAWVQIGITASGSAGSTKSIWLWGSGYYAFTDLEPGRYTMRFSAPGYVDQCYGGNECTELTVEEGELLTGINATLSEADPATITGRVVDKLGHPLAGALLQACSGSCASAVSDADGQVSVQLPGGETASLSLSLAGYSGWAGSRSTSAGGAVDLGAITLLRAANLSGTVTGGATGDTPLAGVRVRVYNDGGYYPVTSVETDSQGRYSFADLAAGFYTVKAEKSGADAAWAFYPSARSASTATVISLGEGTSRTGVDFTLAKWGSISGRVVNPDGEPVEDATVTASERDETGGNLSVKTGSDGTFTLGLLAPGSYAVSASAYFDNDYLLAWWGGSSEASARRVTVTSGSAASGVTLELVPPPSGRLTGLATLGDGSPAADVTVVVRDDDYNYYYSANTDDAGHFEFDHVRVGHYWLYSYDDMDEQVWYPGVSKQEDAVMVEVTPAGAEAFHLQFPHQHQLGGLVTTADGPATSADLILRDEDGDWVTSCWLGDGDDPEDCNGGGEGAYALRVPDGEYVLEVSAEGYAEQRLPVTIAGADVELDVALLAGLTISGTITSSDGFDDLSVIIGDATTGARVSRAYPDATGAYRITGLTPGEYLLAVNDSGHERVFWYGGDSARTATALELAGDVSGIDLTVPPYTGGGGSDGLVTLVGRISLPSGVSWDQDEWLGVTLLDAEGDDYYADVDMDGDYEVSIPSGSYVLVVGRAERYGTMRHSEPLTITADARHDVTLVAGASLSGRAFDSLGRGAYGSVMIARPGAGEDSEDWCQIGSSGSWECRGLEPGTVTATVFPSSLLFTPAEVGGGTTYRLELGQRTVTPDTVLELAGRVSGRVLAGDGDDGSSVGVTVFGSDGKRLGSVWTQPGSAYTIGGLPIGEVRVAFSRDDRIVTWWKDATGFATATSVTVRAGEAARGISPTLPANLDEEGGPEAGYGTITGSISTQIGFGASMFIEAEGDDDRDQAAIASDGSYVLRLRPGTYTVRATLCIGLWMGYSGCLGERHRMWYPTSPTKETAQAVQVVADRTTADVDFVFTDGALFTTVPRPAITGEPRVGTTLTVDAGAWAPAPEELSYRWLRDGEAIDGATGSSYVLVGADEGARISVTVRATLSGYTATSATSLQTTPVSPAELTAGLPTITGTAALGQTLTALAGTWTPQPDHLAHQWFRDGVVIAGATGRTYTVVVADVGAKLAVTVTGSLAGTDPVSATSEPTARIAAGTLAGVVPTISGTAAIGSTLTAATGTWTPAPVTLTYQWRREGSPIAGATGRTYAVGPADGGAKLSVSVTGAKPGYATLTQTSTATATVTKLAFTATPLPRITGAAKVGSTLTVVPGSWTPAPDRFNYVWKRNGVAIVASSGATYTLVGADAGKSITVTVTGVKLGFADATRTSQATGKIAAGAMVATTPTVTGTVRVGQRLEAVTGNWTPGSATFTFQWYRSGKKVKSATTRVYTLVASDLGKRMTVKVTGTAVGYATVTRTSKATAKVSAGSLEVATPTITGVPQVGVTLDAVPGAWGPAPVGFSYQWYRAGKAISKATKARYTPGAADLSKSLTVKVTGSKSGYRKSSAVSVASASVAPGVLSTGTPTISGTARNGRTLTAKPGTWGPATVSFRYQWKRGGELIIGATRATYTITSADVSVPVTVEVTGSKKGYLSATRAAGPVTPTA